MLFTTQRGRKKEINTHKVARGELRLGAPSGCRNARGGGVFKLGQAAGLPTSLEPLERECRVTGDTASFPAPYGAGAQGSWPAE